MKTFFISLFLTSTALSSFSQNACPSYFNTASQNSICGPLGEIKMVYSNGCPGVLPEIDSVYSNGKKCDVTFASPDNSPCNTAYPALRYCLTSGKIPSGKLYVVYFRNPDNSTFVCNVPCNCAVLPVKFTLFTAAIAAGTVSCNWNTENEQDNSYFLLERSEDGRNFSSVATVPANISGKYTANDKGAASTGKSVFYYRVKQVDIDGRFSYSNILSVKVSNSGNTTITPNPFKESVTVSFKANTAGTADIRIMSLSGQVVASRYFTVTKGNNSMLVNGLGSIQRGVYIVQIAVNGAITENQKLVKQ